MKTNNLQGADVVRLAVGEKVPDFTIESSAGTPFQLSTLSGKKVLLYFYPKDNTPGCTLEGHDFNRLKAQFQKLNTEVFGISRDDLKSHKKFIDKCGFRFDLLSDTDEKVCRLFDVIQEKNMYGKKVMGIERSTFIIDDDQKLMAEFRKVKADGHAEQMLDFLKR